MEFFPRFLSRWNLVTGATVVGSGLAAGFFGLLYWNPLSKFADDIENRFILERRRWRLYREVTNAENKWQSLNLTSILTNTPSNSSNGFPPLTSKDFLDEPIQPTNDEVLRRGLDQRRFAVICASNMNRSMEAHYQLMRKGFDVHSFGTGTTVKLPGPSADKPNVYSFGTSYQFIYEDLKQQNSELYTRNGLLPILERNIKVKHAPQQWKEYCSRMRFDVIITYEDRVFESCVEELQMMESVDYEPVYVINMAIKDNHEEALYGGSLTVILAQRLNEYDGVDWEDHIDSIIEQFEKENSRKLGRYLHFY